MLTEEEAAKWISESAEPYEREQFDEAQNSLPDRAGSPSPAPETGTPRPWHLYDRGIGYELHRGSVCHDQCIEINTEMKETFKRADAELIIRAVNRDAAFEALVEALRALYDMVNHALDARDALLISKTCATMDKVRAALALAQPAEKPEEADDPSEPGHPDNPRSDYTVERNKL